MCRHGAVKFIAFSSCTSLCIFIDKSFGNLRTYYLESSVTLYHTLFDFYPACSATPTCAIPSDTLAGFHIAMSYDDILSVILPTKSLTLYLAYLVTFCRRTVSHLVAR